MNAPVSKLPAPTQENAITMQMQFQQQLIITFNRIANSLETISTRLVPSCISWRTVFWDVSERRPASSIRTGVRSGCRQR